MNQKICVLLFSAVEKTTFPYLIFLKCDINVAEEERRKEKEKRKEKIEKSQSCDYFMIGNR